MRTVPSPSGSSDAILHKLTDAEIQAFKARGAAVQLSSVSVGDLWLVPEYTDADRQELSIEHAATLAMLCAAFPGAKVAAFEKSTGR
jgi:hypothetical protein